MGAEQPDPDGDGIHVSFGLRLPGQYFDAETGLHYNYFRDYDPQIGRYLSPDPIGFAGGDVNLYPYVGGYPLTRIDPDGRIILPLDFIWDLGNLIYDAVTGDWESFAADALAFCIPYVPAGTTKAYKAAKGVKGLPSKPDDLLKQGYKDVSHPNAAKAGHRTFENPTTGDKVRFDQGKPTQPAYERQDHYHRYNPNATGKRDEYLDKNGNPCARGCDASHLLPGD